MINILKNTINKEKSRESKQNMTREFLQILILKILFDNGSFKSIAFVGGTALRIIFDSRRFSEDLDFSCIDKKAYNFNKLAKCLKNNLQQYGFDVEIKQRAEKTVNCLEIKFINLFYSLGLSDLKGQKLLIKMEIDTNPPKGYKTELSLVTKMSFVFTITHFDLPSLYATKVHACFYRKFTKGRDFYDLLWYLGQKAECNYEVLNNAIKQTEKKTEKITQSNFIDFLKQSLNKIDLKKAKKDVAHFLIDKNELKLFDQKIFEKIIQNGDLRQ